MLIQAFQLMIYSYYWCLELYSYYSIHVLKKHGKVQTSKTSKTRIIIRVITWHDFTSAKKSKFWNHDAAWKLWLLPRTSGIASPCSTVVGPDMLSKDLRQVFWNLNNAVTCNYCNWMHLVSATIYGCIKNALSMHQHVWELTLCGAPSTKQTAVSNSEFRWSSWRFEILWNSIGVFRQIYTNIMCLHLSYSEWSISKWIGRLKDSAWNFDHLPLAFRALQVAWPGPKRPKRPTSEILAKALEVDMTPFWWDFQDGVVPLNSWLLFWLFCFVSPGIVP